MIPNDDGRLNSKCRSSLKHKFLRACAAAALVWLLFYGFTQTDIKFKASDQSVEPWNMSILVQNTVSKLHAAILPKTIRHRKRVLLWTRYFSSKEDWLPSTLELGCPVTECEATSNRSLLNQSSAVLIHWRNVNVQDLPKCIPSQNAPCPLWVLFNEEAPPHTSLDSLEVLQDKVHWTVTYRRDSDVFAPYGKVLPKKNHSFTEMDFNPDTHLVCWLVSNCNTPGQREIFVNELKRYVEVNVYGKCGTASCPHRLVKDCYRWLSKQCRFYLSFENSYCRDYTTEKLYYALSSGMVPVVMGNRSNYLHLPTRSYIHVSDFSSLKELAEYLKTVGSDEKTYLSYFWWRKHYEVLDTSYMWFCDLCAKLHDTDITLVKPRKSLASWWFDTSQCGVLSSF